MLKPLRVLVAVVVAVVLALVLDLVLDLVHLHLRPLLREAWTCLRLLRPLRLFCLFYDGRGDGVVVAAGGSHQLERLATSQSSA